jgi:hypothetical protein
MGKGADQMRPYEPDNANAENTDTPSAAWQGDATDNASMSASAVARQDVDYSYNSSIDMVDSADGSEIDPENSAAEPADSISRDDEGAVSTTPSPAIQYVREVPADTIDVTPRDAQSPSKDTGGGSKASTADNTDDPEAIRADIEQTRSQMSATIDAIQERLNPQSLVDQAKGAVREATIGRVENMVTEVRNSAQDAGNGLLATIKENPVPAALAAIGIGWLYMKSRNNTQNNYRYQPYDRYNGYNNYDNYNQGNYGRYDAGGRYGYPAMDTDYNRSGGPSDMIGNARDKAGDLAGGALDKAGDLAGKVGGTVGDAAGQARDKVGDVAGSVGDAAGGLVGNAQQKVGDMGTNLQYGASRAQNTLQRMINENPLAVGGAALVFGAAIGMLLPETEPEHRLMGEAKDNVMDKAQAVAQDTMDKVSRVAEQVGNTVQQEAQSQGLTS